MGTKLSSSCTNTRERKFLMFYQTRVLPSGSFLIFLKTTGSLIIRVKSRWTNRWHDLIYFLNFYNIAAIMVPERGGGSWIGVQFQPVVVVRCGRSSGQLRVRSTMRLQIVGIARRNGTQNEHQSQRRRLRSHSAKNGSRRRREQEKLVGVHRRRSGRRL